MPAVVRGLVERRLPPLIVAGRAGDHRVPHAPVPLEYSVGGLTWGFQLRSWRSAWDHRG